MSGATGSRSCLCVGAQELSWVWSGGGRRFTVLSESPVAPNLLTVTLAAGREDEVEAVVAQGRLVPIFDVCRSKRLDAVASALDRCGMCVGVLDEAKVLLAEKTGSYAIQKLDGEAAFAWNERVRQDRCFTTLLEGHGKGRWKSALHAMSQSAAKSVRADACTGLATFGHGEKFAPICNGCVKLEHALNELGRREEQRLKEMADPVLSKQRDERRTGLGSHTTDAVLTADEKRTRDSRVRGELRKLKRKLALAEQAKILREAEGVELTPEQEKDFKDIITCEKVTVEAQQEFEDNPQHEVAAALFADSAKYAKLVDKRGMRWHPVTLRWCLLFYTRANCAAWDEMSSILNLPSGRTLRGYRNQSKGEGFDPEGLARIATKLASSQRKEEEALLAEQQTEMEQLCATGVTAACPAQSAALFDATKAALEAKHRGALQDLRDVALWNMKGCICFDSMTLRKGLLWNSQRKEIEGFEDLYGIADEQLELDAMMNDRSKAVATELLVFWFTSFSTVKASFPLGHFGVTRPDATTIDELWREAVKAAQLHGFRPIAGCCDGAAENEKFTKRICTHSSNDRGFKDYYIDMDTGDRIFIMQCQTHLLKKLRNNIWKSGHGKGQTRVMLHFDKASGKWQTIQWATLLALYEEDIKRFPTLAKLLSHDHLV
jgi:hypothetical protein